ncbi:MAG: glycosyl transferase [Verrucomicrobia bacterium]|nr:glycosyl transferase [Verrucomicrobiota bacterium]
MRFFCTYFDHRYLPRGLALYESLKRHCPAFKLWVLCLTRECRAQLEPLALPEIDLIPLEALERDDPELAATRTKRSTLEYYFTCTPSLPRYILAHCPEVELVTYLDADLFFFADPAPVYDELGGRSIGIIEHRFPESLRHHERYGRFNVGWLSFRRDAAGQACLAWWRARCLEWCHDRCEDGRFADQKYLDNWPEKFQGVALLQHKGANLAPWNLANYQVRTATDGIRVDDQPLIFFHFHALKELEPWLYDSNLAVYGVKLDKGMVRQLYEPYFQTLRAVQRRFALSAPASPFDRAAPRRPSGQARTPIQPRTWLKRLRQIVLALSGTNYLLVRNGRIL